MDTTVCGLKHLSSNDGSGAQHWSRRASFRILQVALLYLAASWVLWAFPHIYDRLTETGHAVLFTFVDTAPVELESGASSSSSQLSIEKPSSENLTVLESSASPLPNPVPVSEVLEVQEFPKEESIRNASFPENAATPETDQQNVVHAEPKVMESRMEEEGEGEVAAEEPPVVASVNLSHLADESIGVPSEAVTAAEGDPGSGGHVEEVLSFSEWTQKQMEEAEKKKVQNFTLPTSGSTSKGSGSLKIRSKNFASPDCGAKVVGSNPEAVSAGSVLSPSRDEYALNACTNRIWFVVELCEAVQARKIELANFELFSSSPQDFSVYVSDRYPSRDWSLIGQFSAKDEKNIQSFNLPNHNLFRKFIKLELHSHYGSEHFCPISLFRVYGTSEYEVLDRDDEVNESVPSLVDEDDDEEPLDIDTGEPPKTLFGSAQDAVLSIVKKAAQVLVKSGDAQNDTFIPEPVNSALREAEFCQSPSHIIVCDNCSEAMYNSVFEILSCRTNFLQRLIDSPFIQITLWTSEMCRIYGLDFGNHRTGAPYPMHPASNSNYPILSDESGYLSALLPPPYIAALCNMLAVLEKKVVLNTSYEMNNVSSVNLTGDIQDTVEKSDSDFENLIVSVPSVCSLHSSSFSPSCVTSASESTTSVGTVVPSVIGDSSFSETSLASQIKPTKTLTKEPDRRNTFHVSATHDPSRDSGTHTPVPETSAIAEQVTLPILPASIPEVTTVENETGVAMESTDTSSSTFKPELASVIAQDNNSLHVDGDVSSSEEQQDSLDTLIKELIEVDPNATATEESISISSTTTTSTTTTVVPPSMQMHKETVFVRLSNRIKVLERNMSLSTQYLEQLSLRYKKQVDEMQKMFNRTLLALREESRKGEEREQRQQEQIEAINKKLSILTSTVEALLEEKQLSWQNKGMVMMQHLIVILGEVIIFILILYLSLRLPISQSNGSQRKWSFGWHGKNQETPRRRRSVEGVSGHASPKPRSRRPSEEALNITGTYQELLIDDSPVTEIDSGTGAVPKLENKRRRRKKKDSLHKTSSNTSTAQKLVGRRNSEHTSYISMNGEPSDSRSSKSTELCRSWSVGSKGAMTIEVTVNRKEDKVCADGEHNNIERVNSEKEQNIQKIRKESQTSADPPLEQSSRENNPSIQMIQLPKLEKDSEVQVLETSIVQGNGTVKSIGMNPKLRRLSSPFFMRTAMATRSSRIGLGSERNPQAKLKSDNWEWYVNHCINRPNKSSQVLLQNGSEHQSNGTSGMEDIDAANTGHPNSDSETQKDMAKKSSSGNTSGLKRMVKKFF